MLTYNMDVEERSTWLRATPGAAAGCARIDDPLLR